MSNFPPGLYVLATPIGNLGDLSSRAAMLLREAALIAAEDTRTTSVLLRAAGSSGVPSTSLTEHNVEAKIPALLAAAADGPVVLVSDAGTPAVADPGARLVEAAHLAHIPVFAVPGPSALAAAISVSGFDGSDVHFLGFLPRKPADRSTRLRAAASSAATLVFFESPGRLARSLADVATVLDDPEVVVCRELTKLHEQVVRGPASQLAIKFATTRGECTVVVRSPQSQATDSSGLPAYMAEMERAGARRSQAAAEAAKRFGVPRAEAYDAWPEPGR